MATDPQFAVTPARNFGQVSVANTARDGSGTVPVIFTAGANGTRVFGIDLIATGTTSVANVVRIFLHDGTNFRLWEEVLVTAITPSTALKVWRTRLDLPQPFVLPNLWSIRASLDTTGPTINIHVAAASL